jgi:signal recognition particle subunit SRP19
MPDFFYVYPAYLERRGSRADGRRVPAAMATEEVTAERIVQAARALGYTAEVQEGKQYPRTAHQFAGRVKLTKRPGISKSAALRALAAAVGSPAEAPREA